MVQGCWEMLHIGVPGPLLAHGLWAPILLLLALLAQPTASASHPGKQPIKNAVKLGPELSNDDIVVAVATAQSRMPLAQATRAFRLGMRTYIITNNETDAAHQQRQYGAEYRETYGFFPDETSPNPKEWHGKGPGDSRAAALPLYAHRHYGPTYKWLLYGDDDTVFFMPNMRKLLRRFDPEVPLALTDNLWYRTHHPRLEAIRCLPCGYDASALPEPQHASGYTPLPACPHCTNATICAEGRNCTAGSGAHGGAGVAISVGLMRALPFEPYMACLNSTRMASGGDAIFSMCLWRAGHAFTDPGHALRFPKPLEHILFDNTAARGFLKQPIDALVGGGCGDMCRSVLRHSVSHHLHGKSFGTFLKAAAGVYGLIAEHTAALEFLELMRGSTAAPGGGAQPRDDL